MTSRTWLKIVAVAMWFILVCTSNFEEFTNIMWVLWCVGVVCIGIVLGDLLEEFYDR